MKNNKLMVNVLFLALLGIACFFGCYNSPSTRSEDSFTEPDLKISAGEITIVTPENKTYTQPDDGYYPGTYGFENDESNSFPKGWVNINEPYAYTKVVDGIDGHNKVLECYSGSETESYLGIKNYFEPQVDGTVEFWLRKSSTESSLIKFSIYGTTQEGLVSLQIDDKNDPNKIKYSDGVQWVDTGYAYSDDTWIHIRIDLDCTTDKYTLWIDEVTYLDNYDFAGSSNEISFNQSYIWSWDGAHPTLCWFDAIGYSWDPNYNIGENLNEGLYLSYDNTTNLDWKGYSLDGQSNKTILGNSTIPMPSDSSHSIQVVGNDTMGAFYESDVRYFTVNQSAYINIITPEKKTYYQPDSGYYPATHGFDNDIPGSEPSGWYVRQPDGDGFIEVDATHAGHNQVLELRKTGGSDKAEVNRVFSDNGTAGTFEFWLYKDTDSGIDPTRMGLYGDDGSLQFGVQNGDLYRNSWYSKVTIGSGVFTINTWHHIRIDFDVSQGWQIRLDDTWYGSGYSFPFEETPTYLYRFGMSSIFSGDASNYGAWLDALDYSWHENYEIGDNLNEGLLISYDNSTNLIWQGFSLDGQDNLTIYGDTTIPMPDDGQHHIQVFGNDSTGTMYQSEVRYFDVDVNPVDISILSPHFNDLYQTTPPDFEIFIDDPDLNSTWYSLDGITNVPFTGFTGAINQAEWDKYSNGTVTIGFYANDSANRINYESVTVRKDILGPLITVISPQDQDVLGFNAPNYALSIEEFNLDEIWCSLDDGITTFPLYGLMGTLNQVEWEKFAAGEVTIRFYANDSLGHESFSDVVVEKDLTSPEVFINSLAYFTNNIFGDFAPDYDITILEENLDSYWYTLDDGETNVSISSFEGSINEYEWEKRGNGTIIIKFYARDEAGNLGSTSALLRKDIIAPILTINLPDRFELFGLHHPNLSFLSLKRILDQLGILLMGVLRLIPLLD